MKAAAGPIDGRGPLAGLRILEIGHFVAAPFACRILADLGAEVIKIEPPQGGDPVRRWGQMVGDRSVWWSVHARNKKSVAIDLKSSAGRALVLELAKSVDGIVENFRPGQLEKWGLGPDDIAAVNPDCVIARISGYGQNGPYRDKPAFGVIGESLGGIRYLTGYPKGESDLPPVRVGVSLGDSVSGLYAVISILAGLTARARGQGSAAQRAGGRGSARVADVALYESVFSLLEGALPEYSLLGVVRQPTGSGLPTAAPSNTYRTRDDDWIIIAANSDPILSRLAQVMGRPDIPTDPRFTTNDKRVANAKALDAIITEWTLTQTAAEAEAALEAADVPCCKIYTIADCAQDAHFHSRDMIRPVVDPGLGELLHPGIVPKFAGADEAPISPGPALGAHTDEVLSRLAGLDTEAIAALRSAGVIA